MWWYGKGLNFHLDWLVIAERGFWAVSWWPRIVTYSRHPDGVQSIASFHLYPGWGRNDDHVPDFEFLIANLTAWNFKMEHTPTRSCRWKWFTQCECVGGSSSCHRWTNRSIVCDVGGQHALWNESPMISAFLTVQYKANTGFHYTHPKRLCLPHKTALGTNLWVNSILRRYRNHPITKGLPKIFGEIWETSLVLTNERASLAKIPEVSPPRETPSLKALETLQNSIGTGINHGDPKPVQSRFHCMNLDGV